ncbi:MAG: N-acetylmuramoyl-L-alanine amidase [Hyphomicrobiaceae bacterium]
MRWWLTDGEFFNNFRRKAPASGVLMGLGVAVWTLVALSAHAAIAANIILSSSFGPTEGSDTVRGATPIVVSRAPPFDVSPFYVGGPKQQVWAETVRLSSKGQQTEFKLQLSAGVTVEVFTLANPYRVVIDMPNVRFRLPAGAGTKARGLVTAFRYGLFSAGKARVVIDTTAPVRIAKAEMTRVKPGARAVNLLLALVPTDVQSFGKGTGAAKAKPKKQANPPTNALALPEKKPSAGPHHKPMIVVDPGHGGIDPGAQGNTRVFEKNVVLDVAKRLRTALLATGRYRVAMTRNKDVFISLDNRLKFSREKRAELFISLHADSLAQKNLANSVRGATVYTLSEKASDEQARRAAEKENSSDLLAGLQTDEGEGGTQVRNILMDLMKRETSNFSTLFSGILVRQLRKATTMRRTPRRSAAFKVLKQTHAPSVLIELGYLSNPKDEGLMRSVKWQRRVAKSVTAAVDGYFRRKQRNSKR